MVGGAACRCRSARRAGWLVRQALPILGHSLAYLVFGGLRQAFADIRGCNLVFLGLGHIIAVDALCHSVVVLVVVIVVVVAVVEVATIISIVQIQKSQGRRKNFCKHLLARA